NTALLATDIGHVYFLIIKHGFNLRVMSSSPNYNLKLDLEDKRFFTRRKACRKAQALRVIFP
uniref:hypothetical protein n=1 Tax=Flavobacterium sp. TaxID=239 RepID=UPI004047A1E8